MYCAYIPLSQSICSVPVDTLEFAVKEVHPMARHITINGQTYFSIDDMPADVRRQYEAAMQLISKNRGAPADDSAGDISISTGGDGSPLGFQSVTNVTSRRIVINGREFARWEDVPAEVQAAFQSAGANPQMPFAPRAMPVADAAAAPMSPRRIMQLGAKWLVVIVLWAAIAGLLFHLALSNGLLGSMSWANWGPGETAQAIQLPDGRYAVMLNHFGRIQIYSSSLQFLYGWNTRNFRGVLRLSSDGNLNLYTQLRYGSFRQEVYDVNGMLLSYDYQSYQSNLPGRGGKMVHILDGSPWWWTYPFRGPLCAFATFFADLLAGIVLSFVLYTREERGTYLLKKISPRARLAT
jgi:hypothetical protein